MREECKFFESRTYRNGETVRIDADYVREHVGNLAKNADLSRFIL